MSWSLVQDNSTWTNQSVAGTVAYSSNVTAGNLLVAIAGNVAGSSNWTISDTQGNTWTLQITETSGAGSSQIRIWTARANSTGATSVTFTPSSEQGTFNVLAVAEYNNSNGWLGIDSTHGNYSTSGTTTPTSGTIPVNATGELVLAAFLGAYRAGSNWTPGTGFTLGFQSVNDTNGHVIFLDHNLNASTSLTDNVTGAFSTFWTSAGISVYGVPIGTATGTSTAQATSHWIDAFPGTANGTSQAFGQSASTGKANGDSTASATGAGANIAPASSSAFGQSGSQFQAQGEAFATGLPRGAVTTVPGFTVTGEATGLAIPNQFGIGGAAGEAIGRGRTYPWHYIQSNAVIT